MQRGDFNWSFLGIAAAILVVGALLRLVGLFGDFWLDEIWSWGFAMSLKSPFQILFLHHDNNHYLNTLWIYLCGQQQHWYVYRLHSYFAGILTIIGCGCLTYDLALNCYPQPVDDSPPSKRKKGLSAAPIDPAQMLAFARMSALVTMLLLATCDIACVYSTEARGYAMAGAAAVFSTYLLRQIIADSASGNPRLWKLLAYAGLCEIGFLSHLTFITVYAPQLVWSVFILWRRNRLVPILVCHVPPIALLATLWQIDLKDAMVGGAPLIPLVEVIPESLALPLGVHAPDWLILLCDVVVVCLLLIGTIVLLRYCLTDGVLFGLLVILTPPLLFEMRSSGLLAPRHFFIVWMVLFPLLGLSVAWTAVKSGYRWAMLLAILGFWIATNGWEFSQFAQYGRGGFERSVDWLMAEARRESGSSQRVQTVGSDHDFRNSLVLSFYSRKYLPDIPFTYVGLNNWPPEGVDWLITHNINREFEFAKVVETPYGPYDLVHLERYAAPIGWHWAIYRHRSSKPTRTSEE